MEMAFAVSGVQCSVRSPYTAAVTKQTLMGNVAARAAERARMIEIDSAEKHAAWIATLDALRTKKKAPEDAEEVEIAAPAVEATYHYSEKAYTLQNFLDKSAPATGVDTGKAVWWNGSAQTASGSAPSPPPPATSKSKKSKKEPPASASKSTTVAAPASAAVKKKGKSKTTAKKAPVVADIVQEVRPGDFPSPAESSAPAAASAPAVEEKKSSTTQETDTSLDGLKKFGAGLLDAIVDGVEVEPTPSENTPTAAGGKKAIPDNVVAAVQEGKLKALTVTKLRRMLSDCGLKTSGRKSELIARLTSFVRS